MSDAIAPSSTERLKKAFADALSLPPGADFETLAYAATPGWDSVAHMALVAEIEGAFDIMFSTDDVIGMSNFAIARQTVARHGVVLD